MQEDTIQFHAMHLQTGSPVSLTATPTKGYPFRRGGGEGGVPLTAALRARSSDIDVGADLGWSAVTEVSRATDDCEDLAVKGYGPKGAETEVSFTYESVTDGTGAMDALVVGIGADRFALPFFMAETFVEALSDASSIRALDLVDDGDGLSDQERQEIEDTILGE